MDIDRIINELTTKEKVSLLAGKDVGYLAAIERLGISGILMTDGPHGVRVSQKSYADKDEPYTFGEGMPATIMPCEAAMAATFNRPLIQEMAGKMGKECQYYGVSVLLGPGVNGKRSPLGGRNFEYFSEDPYLTGKMAVSFIKGVQSEGVGTSLKHFALNEQETRRMTVNVDLEERALREIYLKPFEMAIKEAEPWSVMASYNRVRGKYACENSYLLRELLREEFGFKGLVMSDWGAVNSKLNSHKNGLDLEMPGPGKDEELLESIQNGEFSIEELNRCVRNVLTLIEKGIKGKREVTVNWHEHHQTAVSVAEEAVVLLKNEEDILPLAKDIEIAVIGDFAKNPRYKGGGSSGGTARRLDIPLTEIQKIAKVEYARGYDSEGSGNEKLIEEAKKIAAGKKAVLVFAGTIDTEGLDRKDINLPETVIALIEELAKVNQNLILIGFSGSVIAYAPVEASVKAILHGWVLGEGCGSAIANILFGDINPSGKLSETFPVSLENNPSYQYFPGYKDEVNYKEDLLVGYRFYDTAKIRPQYPFGFGMSYTTFSFGNMKLSQKEIRNGERLLVSLDVTNTGGCYGKEVVQIYVEDVKSQLFRPRKELKGFEKVGLNPGETKRVELALDESAFSYFVPHLKRFAVESGEFLIHAGTSLTDILETESLWFHSEDEVRLPLGENDLFKDFLEDDRYAYYAKQVVELLHVDYTSEIYLILYGFIMKQVPKFLSFFQIPHDVAVILTDSIVQRKEIPEEIKTFFNENKEKN